MCRVNARTAKLLRRYSTLSGEPIAAVKREWKGSTPSERRDARQAMLAGLWAGKVRAWQKRMEYIQKQAADALKVPFETYRDWCDGDHEPHKIAREAITQLMAKLEAEKIKNDSHR